MNQPRSPRLVRRGQRGVVAIIYAVLLRPLLACAGLALELSPMCARRHEMQSVADSAALPPPYGRNGNGCFLAPSVMGELKRRVLNVPLREFPAGEDDKGVKKMLGIGAFLMTSAATAASVPRAIPAGFGGLVTCHQLAASAVLSQ